MGAGLHRDTRGGGRRMEGGAWEGQSARTRLTLMHTRDRARTGSCTHVHMLIHTRACLGTQTPTRVPTHSLSHTTTSTLTLLHIKQGRARGRSHAGAGTRCRDGGVYACPRDGPAGGSGEVGVPRWRLPAQRTCGPAQRTAASQAAV